LKKKEEVNEWEKQTNDCVTYQCGEVNGLIAWSMCNSTDDVHRVCVADKCVEEKTTGVYVEVEMKEGVEVKDIHVEVILEALRVECAIDTDGVNIGWESDANGHIIRVMIYVEDEHTAQLISVKIENMDKGDNCSFDVICYGEEVQLKKTDNISLSSTIEENVVILLAMLALLLQ